MTETFTIKIDAGPAERDFLQYYRRRFEAGLPLAAAVAEAVVETDKRCKCGTDGCIYLAFSLVMAAFNSTNQSKREPRCH